MSGSDRPVALVTGGARRVGLAIAAELARGGCDVHLTYLRSEREAGEACGLLRGLGAAAGAHRLDLADLDAVEEFGGVFRDRFGGRLDVLVHNASVYEATPLETLSGREAARVYTVNALAPLVLTKSVAGLLRASGLVGGGAVVAMADIHAMGEHGLPREGYSAYAMSKAALVEMVRTLARELAPRVRVNAVAPGVVAWPEEGLESDEALRSAYLSRVPLARAGTPDDAARAVRWLALEAGYVTGEVVRVDGGRNLR